VGDAACRLEVSDAGQGCRPFRRRPARGQSEPRRESEYDALAESGRGFAIMRACMDEVTLHSAPGQGTQVVLDKRIHREPPLAA
jgi:anti-sigma regulatory factor (Ser/Thr protein kinase)